jgi:DNA-directed RNA polymerase specialized sigma24 family protein
MKQKPSSKRKRSSTKSILRLPDLEHAKAAVLNSLNSPDAKRDVGYKLTLDESIAPGRSRSVNLIALDDALSGLAKLDQQQNRIVELCFCAGLSIEEASQVLDVSPATVKRHWHTAKLCLYNEICKPNTRDVRTHGTKP